MLAPGYTQRSAPGYAQRAPVRRFVSRRRRGPILVGLSLFGIFSAGILLLQYPNFIPLVGVTVGGLILLTGIFLAIRVAIRALVKRAQSRAAQSRELEWIRQTELRCIRPRRELEA